jgi:hypothetical protein
MVVCPRCNANVPEGTERCLVCGYGLPGTSAELADPKDTPPAKGGGAKVGPHTELVETGAPGPEQGAGSVAPPDEAGGMATQPVGPPLFATTEQQAVAGAGTSALAGDRANELPDMERTSIMATPVTGDPRGPVEPTEPSLQATPRRRFPVNTVLAAAVAAIAVAVLVFALTSGSGSGGTPKSGTTTTSGGHVVVPASSSTTSSSTTTSSTTSTTLPAPTTTSTPPSTTTSTSVPRSTTTSTSAPRSTTTSSSSTTSTTVPRSTTTTVKG